MNFWKNPEYDSVKMVVIAVLVTAAGLFVYDQMKVKPLANAGRVISPSSSTGPGGTGGGKGGGGGDYSCDSVLPVVLTSALGAPTTPTSVTTATGGVIGGQWLNFTLTNPSNCPVDVSKVELNFSTNDLDNWPPVQNVTLSHSGVQLGAALKVPHGTTYVSGAVTTGTHTITVNSSAGLSVGNRVRVLGTPSAQGTVTAIPTGTTVTVNFAIAGAGIVAGTQVADFGPGLMTFSFPGTSAVTIAPMTTETFNVASNSQNVPAMTTGLTPTPVYFKFGLREFLGTSLPGVVNDQSVTAGSIPPTIVTPSIHVL